MIFKYLLNGIEIEEPIGFDAFKPVIERTDHHGISASISFNKIGFYGKAFTIIKDSYNTDIDIELQLIVQIKANSTDDFWSDIYYGIVDLSTYEQITENGLCKINCNVGEIGLKTTFNNRIDTKVELTRENSLDDVVLPEYPMLKREIQFPSKEILVASRLENITDEMRSIELNYSGFYGQNFNDIYLQPGLNIVSNEFDTMYGLSDFLHWRLDSFMPNIFLKFLPINEINYKNITLTISFDLNLKIYSFTDTPFNSDTIELIIFKNNDDISFENGLPVYKNRIDKIVLYSGTKKNEFDLEFEKIYTQTELGLLLNDTLSFYLKISIDNQTLPTPIHIDLTATKFDIKFNSITTFNPTKAKISLVHEAFSRLSEIISNNELKVKSDWYGRSNSNINPTVSTITNPYGIGGGALKAILNGYELRNAELPSEKTPKLMLSFKDLFEAINSIDNIGWGFSEENGTIYLRIERWKWFYQDYVIMEINNPNNVKRSVQENKVYTRLKIGYEKYIEEQEVNAIDTFHTDREYSTGLKSVDVLLENLCKFISDPYAIELTRRQQSQNTSSWKYDEDIFIVSLCIRNRGLYIDDSILDSENITSPKTTMNLLISPQRNAIRWAERYFEINSSRDILKLTAGRGNLDAKGRPYIYSDPTGNPILSGYNLEDSAKGIAISEREDIHNIESLLRPEILSFDYPITFYQYKNILSNPYGKIIVDDEECYIKKITHNLIGGIASFELIPKKTQND